MISYADLDALAAKGDGTLWRYGQRWTYPGAPTQGAFGRHRFLESVPDSRVQAALASGDYVPYAKGIIDVATVDPAMVQAVIAKPASGLVLVRSAADLGTYAAVIGGKEGSLPTAKPPALGPPAGFVYLIDPDGSRLTDADGAYLMEAA